MCAGGMELLLGRQVGLFLQGSLEGRVVRLCQKVPEVQGLPTQRIPNENIHW